jgi:hypothetical protein
LISRYNDDIIYTGRGEMIERKPFATSIDKQVAKDFKLACIQNDVNMNDVLETFMKGYAAGTILIEAVKSK